LQDRERGTGEMAMVAVSEEGGTWLCNRWSMPCQPTTTTNLAMSSKKIAWCLILDKMRPDGESFPIEYEDDNIATLKEKVHARKSTLLDGVDLDKLRVWKCKDPETAFTEEEVKKLFADQKVDALGPKRRLAKLQPALSEDDTLLVQVPGMFHFSFFLIFSLTSRKWTFIEGLPTATSASVITNEVHCLLIDHEKRRKGTAFKVTGNDIMDLRKGVKLEKPNDCPGVDADHLIIWQCKDQKLLSTASEKDMDAALQNINFLDENAILKLTGGMDLKDLGLIDKELLLVQVPGTFYPPCPFQ